MAFLLKTRANGFGGGGLGALNVTTQNMVVNAYAQVTAVSGDTVTLGNIGDASKFKVGSYILVHVSGYKGTGTFSYLGNWIVTRIMKIDGSTLTVFNKKVGEIAGKSSDALIQAVTIPEYTTVTLNANSSITCPQFNQTTGYGGLVALKCSEELKFAGGDINLENKGLPNASLRPLFNFESDEKLTGYENYQRESRLPINFPHGAAFILTKKMTCHEDSRIGQPGQNNHEPRKLEALPGGANIFIAAEEISEFKPIMISKNGTANGKGRAGCYIATEDYIPCDEGLYAFDRLTSATRMTDTFMIKDFGDGSFGAKTNYTNRLNSYAQITGIDKTRKILTIGQRDNNGLAKIANGALVMLHATYNPNTSGSSYFKFSGFFTVARILDYTLSKITIDRPFKTPNNSGNLSPEHYGLQLVTIPQFTDFTLSSTNEALLAYDKDKGYGGIVALACTGTCNLKGGKILTVGKGGAWATEEYGLNYESNARMAESLPIGEGNGSVFILAKTLDIDKNTRLGGDWSGEGFGGSWNGGQASYGYAPADDNEQFGSGKRAGKGVGVSGSTFTYDGGYNSNGIVGANQTAANQGAHILIIADKITNMNLAALSTGGQGGQVVIGGVHNYAPIQGTTYSFTTTKGGNGGAGYGGGSGNFVFHGQAKYGTPNKDVVEGYVTKGGSGGWLGGAGGHAYSTDTTRGVIAGGGSGGFCFVYCNSFDSEDKSWLAYD